MDYSRTAGYDRSKLTKMALVGTAHLFFGAALVHSLATVHLPPKEHMIDLVPLTPEPPKPKPKLPDPPPLEPAKLPPMQQIPLPEIPIVQTPPPEAPRAVAVAEPSNPPSTAVTAAPPSNNPVADIGRAVAMDGCTPPAYPTRALRNNETGTTTLALLVGPDGRVQDARVQHSSGSRDLDRAAVQGLSQCRFQPALSHGQAQAGWARLDYVWTLEG